MCYRNASGDSFSSGFLFRNPFMPVECCLFDMGNVLVRFSHDRMCKQLANLFQTTPAVIRNGLFDSGLQWAYERGELTPDELAVQLNSKFGTQISRIDMEHAGSDIFEPNDDIESVIAAIHRSGIPLVLLSNTSISHFQFVQSQYSILKYFRSFVLSYEVGALKPSATMFEAAARQIGCPTANCFYTDDISDYVTAGRQHGFDSELFTNVSSLRQQLQHRGIELVMPDGQAALDVNPAAVATTAPSSVARSQNAGRTLRKPA